MFSSPPNLHRYDSEKSFLSRRRGSKHKFPSIQELASVDLSVIVPSYNEEERCKRYARFAVFKFTGLNNMAEVLQRFSNVFSLMKIFVF